MLEITNDMDSIIHKKKAIVYFSANWCQPCKLLKPQMAKLAMQDEINTYYFVDVDEIHSHYLAEYGIQSIPQIFVLENGAIKSNIKGRNFDTIKSEIESI